MLKTTTTTITIYFGGALFLQVLSLVFGRDYGSSSFITTRTSFAFQRYHFDSPSFVSCSRPEPNNEHCDIAEAYHHAKFIRKVYGPEAAAPLYQTIVSHLNPNDYSAASRIAAAATTTPSSINSSSSSLLTSIGPLSTTATTTTTTSTTIPSLQHKQDIRSFANVLRLSNFTASNVNTIFNAPKTYNALCTATGPIYVKPTTSTYPPIPCPFLLPSNRSIPNNFLEINNNVTDGKKGDTHKKDSVECLVALFLLGFALPKNVLASSLIGGHDTVCLMERLGLIFTCTVDPTLMVPAVSIFPLDIHTNIIDTNYYNLPETPQKEEEQIMVISLYFVTDWHPNVLLSTTASGMKEELHEGAAVMYIGPDSLALVSHWPAVLLTQLPLLLQHKQLQHPITNDTITTTTNTSFWGTDHTIHTQKGIKLLDLCCGSGIQALSYLSILKYFLSTNELRKLKATCVDINRRALRFTRFNAILNDLDESVETIEGNILDWEETFSNHDDDHHHANTTLAELQANYHQLLNLAPYDIILANPPFIPVPPPEVFNTTGITNTSCTTTAGPYNHHHSCCNNDTSLLLVDSISTRYGLFSSGGPSGEDILQSIIRIAPRLLSESNDTNSVVAIVSEFMNPDNTLIERINESWSFHHHRGNPRDESNTVHWSNALLENNREKTSSSSTHSPDYTDVGLAFTNQFPVPAELYASRRAADRGGLEEQRWKTHLNQMGIHSISPGLLFIYRVPATMDNHRTIRSYSNTTDEKDYNTEKMRIRSFSNISRLNSYQVILPKSNLGSIWTPHNYEGIIFAIKKIKELLFPYITD
jgi:methylase of polypeptide subunit release factors